jgi:signal transduction histidine kinase
MDVGMVVERAIRNARARAGGRTVSYVAPEADATLTADNKMLAIAVNQLLDNAIKHTPEETRVEASVVADEAGVTVFVDDSGPGMPEDSMEHLFEHFYRSDAARSRSGAAGLGLTITAAIASAHGGSVRAESSPLGGLRIVLRIPHVLPAD